MLDPDDTDEFDDIIAKIMVLETNDKPDDKPDDKPSSGEDPDMKALEEGLEEMTLNPMTARISWPSGPYYPGSDKPQLTVTTRNNDDYELDKDTSHLLRLLVTSPNLQENLQDTTFISNFVDDVIRFSGVDLGDLLPEINWPMLINEIKNDKPVDYKAIADAHSVIYVNEKPYRQRQFSLPLPGVNSDGTITFPIRPSDVTLNTDDISLPWLAQWVNPNTGEDNFIRLNLREPLTPELDLVEDNEEVTEVYDDSGSEYSIDSDDGLSSDSDSDNEDDDDGLTKVNQRGPRPVESDVEDVEFEEVDVSLNLDKLSKRERNLLPLNMLNPDYYQTMILERARRTNGRLVKDLVAVYDANLLNYYNELAEAQDPMAPYFANYIEQRA